MQCVRIVEIQQRVIKYLDAPYAVDSVVLIAHNIVGLQVENVRIVKNLIV